MFGIFKGFKEFIFGPAVIVKSPTETEAPYKIEQPAVVEPVSVETTPAQPSLAVIDTTPVVETAVVEIPAKKPRKPRKPKLVAAPAKKPTKASVVKIAEAKKSKGKSKKS
jgi:hypothetical protein